MLHGDISNRMNVTIGFRLEDTLIKVKDKKLRDRLANSFCENPYERGNFDERCLSVMSKVFRNTEYNADIVILKDNYTDAIKARLDDVPFNRVVLIQNELDITMRLKVGDLTYYVDETEETRQKVNSDYAVSLADLSRVIKYSGG